MLGKIPFGGNANAKYNQCNRAAGQDDKKQAEEMFAGFGMNFSTAVNIFIRQSLRQGKIPFEIRDPFYSDSNQAELNRRIADIEAGRATFVVKTMEELERMADEHK